MQSNAQAQNRKDAEIQAVADELRAIAAFGLNFTDNPYDAERYQAVLAAGARLDGLINGRSPADLLAQYQHNSFQLGAHPSAEAIVRQDGKILLVQRADNGLWALPGGVTDPGETLAQSAQRELWEETGICGDPVKLLGIFDSRRWRSQTKLHFYHALFLMQAASKSPRPSAETPAAAYFSAAELPPLSPGHHLRVPFVFKQLRGAAPLPYFDRVEAPYACD